MDLPTEQRKDPKIKEIIEALERYEEIPKRRHLLNIRKNSLNMELYLLVVPNHMKKEILYEMYDALSGAHMGVAKTWNRIKTRFIWPKIYSDVRNYVLSCEECARVKTDTTKPKGLLQPWTIIEKTFQRVGIDTLGKFPVTANGNRLPIKRINRNLERMSEKSKKRFDKNRQQIDFSPGDLVYLRKPNRKVGLSEKLLPQYSGPWEIVMKTAPNNYQITNHTRKKMDIVNVERLKRFNK
uniref:RNA-directed DNA polymerase n=1 Tax=Strigamia maritima TaxID=126957 RepID=T1J941_STRMM